MNMYIMKMDAYSNLFILVNMYRKIKNLLVIRDQRQDSV